MAQTNTIANLDNISALLANDVFAIDDLNDLDIFGAPITKNVSALQLSNYINKSFGAATFIANCDLAQITNIVGTYNNGTAGVGATFTVTATGALTVDGVTAPLGYRILLGAQTTAFQNGIWTVTTAGALGVSAVLTRATDYDTASEIVLGTFTSIQRGLTLINKTYIQANTNITVGTTSVVWQSLQSTIMSTTASLAIGGTGGNFLVGTGGGVLTLPAGTKTIYGTGDAPTYGALSFSNGTGIKTGTTAADTYLLTAYDVDGVGHRTFATFTANNTPSVAWSQPAGSILTWDGGVIGGITPAAATFTTVAATTFTGALVGNASTATTATTAGTVTTAAQPNITSTGVLVTGTQVKAGSGSGSYDIVTSANVQYTPVGNVGGGEDDLMSYPLPANSFSAAGKTIFLKAWGTGANNINAKTVNLYVGGTQINTAPLVASVAGVWEAELLLICSGSSTQSYYSKFARANLAGTSDVPLRTQGTGAKTDTADIIIKFTGTATADNDITQNGMIVEFLN